MLSRKCWLCCRNRWWRLVLVVMRRRCCCRLSYWHCSRCNGRYSRWCYWCNSRRDRYWRHGCRWRRCVRCSRMRLLLVIPELLELLELVLLIALRTSDHWCGRGWRNDGDCCHGGGSTDRFRYLRRRDRKVGLCRKSGCGAAVGAATAEAGHQLLRL